MEVENQLLQLEPMLWHMFNMHKHIHKGMNEYIHSFAFILCYLISYSLLNLLQGSVQHCGFWVFNLCSIYSDAVAFTQYLFSLCFCTSYLALLGSLEISPTFTHSTTQRHSIKSSRSIVLFEHLHYTCSISLLFHLLLFYLLELVMEYPKTEAFRTPFPCFYFLPPWSMATSVPSFLTSLLSSTFNI